MMKKQKMLVTGAHGFLGTRVCLYYNDKYDVIGLGHDDLDITDLGAVEDCMCRLKPDVVVHCAAISNTGYAQTHPAESYAVNYLGSVNIAKACAVQGAALVYMSSDQVYSGNRETGLLDEGVQPCANNVYGQHKLAAERAISSLLPRAVGLRLTWMFDHPASALRLNSNVLVNIWKAHEEKRMLTVPVSDHRGFTWVWDVVKRLDHCRELPGGVYNFGCENDLNSYESFLCIARWMGLPHSETWILPNREAFAEAPRNLSISIDKLRRQGLSFPTMEESVRCAMARTDGSEPGGLMVGK